VDSYSTVAVRRALRQFIDSFDGSSCAGHVLQIYDGKREDDGQSLLANSRFAQGSNSDAVTGEREATESELFDLHSTLLDILRRGFPDEQGYPKPSSWQANFDTLWFGARSAHRHQPRKLHPHISILEQTSMSKAQKQAERRYVAASKRERQSVLSPGAYVLVVNGALRDLVPYLLLQLLTAPGMALVTRCPAPAPHNWDQRCGRFLVGTTERGRPRVFCSGACRVRTFAKELPEKQARKINRRTGRRK
jgi:hypothetical protein